MLPEIVGINLPGLSERSVGRVGFVIQLGEPYL